MKSFFTILLTLSFTLSSLCAAQVTEAPKSKNCKTGNIAADPNYACEGILGVVDATSYECGGIFPSDAPEDNDPLEPFNRVIFELNQGIDYVLIEPIAGAYKEILPEHIRIGIANILRNLNEPIVLANNLLQGELEDARGTMWRFVFNSTLGVGGIFDVSTKLGIPYKKEDLGLTFAAWGVESGPYLVLPILGPSTLRDGWGRIGDYAVDPINWWTFGVQSTSRSSVQILDAKTDNLEIVDDIKKNAIDYYASIRSWYTERRKSLINKEDQVAPDSPRPDEEIDSIGEIK